MWINNSEWTIKWYRQKALQHLINRWVGIYHFTGEEKYVAAPNKTGEYHWQCSFGLNLQNQQHRIQIVWRNLHLPAQFATDTVNAGEASDMNKVIAATLYSDPFLLSEIYHDTR